MNRSAFEQATLAKRTSRNDIQPAKSIYLKASLSLSRNRYYDKFVEEINVMEQSQNQPNMKSLKAQTDAQIEQTRKAKPEFMAKIDATIENARKFEEGGNALKVGQTAPDFQLPDARDQKIALSKLLEKGPAVIVFYRGSWCPYCNLQLRALQARLSEIHANGAELIAISPQVPDESLSQIERDTLEFLVLSDQNAAVASSFGVAWEVPETILEHMRKDRKLDLADINNGNGSILPIPATFIIDKSGIIAWSHVDVDYRTRPEPSEVVSALQSITSKV